MSTVLSSAAAQTRSRTVIADVQDNGEATLTVNYKEKNTVVRTSTYTFSLLLQGEEPGQEEDVITKLCTRDAPKRDTSKQRLIRIAEKITSFVLDALEQTQDKFMIGKADIDLTGLEITDLTEKEDILNLDKTIYADGNVFYKDQNEKGPQPVEANFPLKELITSSKIIPLFIPQPLPSSLGEPPTTTPLAPATSSPPPPVIVNQLSKNFQTPSSLFINKQNPSPLPPPQLITPPPQQPPAIASTFPLQKPSSSQSNPSEKQTPPPSQDQGETPSKTQSHLNMPQSLQQSPITQPPANISLTPVPKIKEASPPPFPILNQIPEHLQIAPLPTDKQNLTYPPTTQQLKTVSDIKQNQAKRLVPETIKQTRKVGTFFLRINQTPYSPKKTREKPDPSSLQADRTPNPQINIKKSIKGKGKKPNPSSSATRHVSHIPQIYEKKKTEKASDATSEENAQPLPIVSLLKDHGLLKNADVKWISEYQQKMSIDKTAEMFAELVYDELVCENDRILYNAATTDYNDKCKKIDELILFISENLNKLKLDAEQKIKQLEEKKLKTDNHPAPSSTALSHDQATQLQTAISSEQELADYRKDKATLGQLIKTYQERLDKSELNKKQHKNARKNERSQISPIQNTSEKNQADCECAIFKTLLTKLFLTPDTTAYLPATDGGMFIRSLPAFAKNHNNLLDNKGSAELTTVREFFRLFLKVVNEASLNAKKSEDKSLECRDALVLFLQGNILNF